MMEHSFDAVIIGAGQAAALTRLLTKAGWKVALIEKKRLGKLAVARPRKLWCASTEAAYTAAHGEELGLLGGQSVRIDLKKVKTRKEAIVLNSRRNDEWLTATWPD
jgi:pyruvate/2-oxoglutarate dehydrogenase complex dihydrolipoamide dehydrogenase (E3) component